MELGAIFVRCPGTEDFPTMAEIKVRGWQTAYSGIVSIPAKAFCGSNLRRYESEEKGPISTGRGRRGACRFLPVPFV